MDKITIEEFELKLKRHDCHMIEDYIDKYSSKIKRLEDVKEKSRSKRK